jgi:hypothetical protein
VAEVPDFIAGDQVPDEVKKGIPDTVVAQAREKKLFARVERGNQAGADKTLLVKGQVVQYNPGSRGMRWLTGPMWGAGRGSVIVNIKFLDKASAIWLPSPTSRVRSKAVCLAGA